MEENTSTTNGNDAVCFTAGGIAGAAFAAGTIHAYLAADRPPPAVAAGISIGAVSAAALQRCFLERETEKELLGPEREAKRWEWFRRYLLELSDQPLNMFWDAIPDQSDFFADRPPIRNTATPPRLAKDETDALEQRYLLTKLGWWLGNMPISVGKVMNILVSYVRWKEDYPEFILFRGARLLWALICVFTKLLLYSISPKSFFLNWQFGEKPLKRWIRRPLFGWWLYGGACLFLLALFLVVPSGFFLFSYYACHALDYTCRALGDHVDWLWTATICSIVTLWIGVDIIRTKILFLLLEKLKLERGFISDFHLRAKLTRIFDPEEKKAPVTDYPMPVVIVAASLQTVSQPGSDNSSVPFTTQLWAQPIKDPQDPGIPLRGYPGTRVGESRELLDSWCTAWTRGVREHGEAGTSTRAVSVGSDRRTMGDFGAAASPTTHPTRRCASPGRYARRARHVAVSESDRVSVGYAPP